ncbi:MAG: DUF2254 domain-containing protein [Pseudomonadota bacterium]
MSDLALMKPLRRGLHLLRLDKPIALFSTVPALISLAIFAAALVLIWVDLRHATMPLIPLFEIPYDTARPIFTTIAAAAMTALSLCYSLTLIVFTLAAGNIGPRLLNRFTSERTNQLTAGIFGGTFLFSLMGAIACSPAFVPHITLFAAIFLAVLSVVMLIYFVRHVASSVTIDEELAKIGTALTRDIDTLMDTASTGQTDGYKTKPAAVIEADEDGYIGWIEEEALVAFAAANALHLEIALPPGKFVLTGTPLVRVYAGEGASPLTEHGRTEILSSVFIQSTRSQTRNIEFAIHLIVEIGLRALSPGTNDTFTAISCIDRLSSVLRRPVAANLDSSHRFDKNAVARLKIPGLSVSDLIRTAFSPFRRAAVDNVLMASHIASALARLKDVAHPDVVPILDEQAAFLQEALQSDGLLDTDLDLVARRLDT